MLAPEADIEMLEKIIPEPALFLRHIATELPGKGSEFRAVFRVFVRVAHAGIIHRLQVFVN